MRTLGVVVVLLLAACGERSPTLPDAPALPDGGGTADAPAADADPTAPDSSTGTPDASTGTPDASTGTPDASTVLPDAGGAQDAIIVVPLDAVVDTQDAIIEGPGLDAIVALDAIVTAS
jgi:hypothetical protein